MGRPTKLTAETQQKIIGGLLLGLYQEQAALNAGISTTTFYQWMSKGRTPNTPYTEFRDAVEKARAEAEARKLSVIHTAAESGVWQAAAWFLERSFPSRWGRRVEVTTITLESVEAEIARIKAEQAEETAIDSAHDILD